MFDLITIVTPPLSNDKIDLIVLRNGLQENSRDGVVFYDNLETKNLIQQRGVYVKIDTNKRLKAEGSLQKFWNELLSGDRNNYNMFTMSDAKMAMKNLLHEKGIDADEARVYNYEIGLNLNVSKDCIHYLNKMKSIGTVDKERELYVNPIYENPMQRNERTKVTGMYKVRKHYKAYDKVHESKQKKRKIIPEGNILRIETVMRRLSNCSVNNFLHPDNLHKMVEAFFRDWRTIKFEQDIITPKGTGRAKQALCLEIMAKGRDEVLRESKARHASRVLTDREYRNIREFITREWDDFKKHITFIQSEEEKDFRELLNINHVILRNDEIGK